MSDCRQMERNGKTIGSSALKGNFNFALNISNDGLVKAFQEPFFGERSPGLPSIPPPPAFP